MELSLREVLDCGTPSELSEAIRRVQGNDPDVVKICIRQNDIGIAKAQALANAIAGSEQLLGLDLRYNKIGDHGCRLIADAIQLNSSIGELRLSPNDVGREGAKWLQAASHAARFESLSVSSATLRTPELSMSPMLLRNPGMPQ
eukprot:TRINITY_DN33096_c0_g1_i1.p1 TRINITY_DN33096_c0_g1~~TRINITY_DN33096_c0_g1_i1.p1  ORF type:complete len:144 (+),score=45.48 TRINITY_DN33096_c0_g1_i1:354-785(+)